jgi:hypothetical protein
MKLSSLFALSVVLVLAGCGTQPTVETTTTTTPTPAAESTVTPPVETTTKTETTTTTVETTTAPVETETPSTTADLSALSPSCQKYVNFMQCVVSKTPEAARSQAQAGLDQAIAQFKTLSVDQQTQACDMATKALEANKDSYAQLGCEIK